MKRLLQGLTVAVLLLLGSAVQAQPMKAEALEEEGRWDEACRMWESMSREDPGNRTLVERWLLALEASGQEEALNRVAGEAAAGHPGWEEPFLFRCRNAVRDGRLDDALSFLNGLRSLEAESWRGRVLALKGERAGAEAAFQNALKQYAAMTDPGPRDHLAAGWAYRGVADFQNAARAMQTAYQDSLDYLPARLALARLFHEKYQVNLAKDELQEARKLSPHHPDLFLAGAEISVSAHSFVTARDMLEEAERLAGPSRMSRLLWARMDLVAGQWDAAEDNLKDLLQENPGDAGAETLWAAHAYMNEDPEQFDARCRRLESLTGSPVEAYLAVADLLELAVRTQEALDMYRRVVDKEPENAEAWSSMGLLTMRLGREGEAREYLEKAFALDQYNVRAYNQLELLDFMEKFQDYPFDTFTLRLLPETDSTLVDLMAREMQSIRAELTERLQWEPRHKTVIEVFPSHDWFSARITGLAWVEGIPGVCFGDVLAMDSPRYLAGHSNWREILKHEFGHVVALDMTERKVPFWFTEGLSVYLEDVPPEISWDQNLVAADWDGKLVSIDSLTIAFTRPESQYQRLLAYHQASIIIRSIADGFGWDVIPKMLKRFGAGESLPEVVSAELHLKWEDFRRFTANAVRKEAESLPLWPRVDAKRSERLETHLGSPEADRRHLIALYTESRRDRAAERAREILEIRPQDPTANGILGLLTADKGESEEARRLMERAATEENSDFNIWMGIGAVRLADGDSTQAEAAYRRALDLYPKSGAAALHLARLARAQDRPEDADQFYSLSLALDDSFSQASLEWARYSLERENVQDAEAALDYAEGIIPLEPDLYALRGEVRLIQDRDDEAYALFIQARHLDLRNVECMVGMAAYYLKQEDYEEALYFANLALKYKPKHREALRIQRVAEAEI